MKVHNDGDGWSSSINDKVQKQVIPTDTCLVSGSLPHPKQMLDNEIVIHR